MKGADEYAELFETGQFGRLYIVSSEHARGKTFRVYVLPADEPAKPNGPSNGPLNTNAVEVYGVISGNPGWTESYGWLHKGNWCEDFKRLVQSKRLEAEDKVVRQQVTTEELAVTEKNRMDELLATY